MIHDVAEFRLTGAVSRRIAELNIPVAAWRAAMCHAGRCDGARVRTFLIPLGPLDADDPGNQLVFAVRTDPPPDPAVQQQGQLRWWRVDDLAMPFDRWRAALHKIARQRNVRVQTFLVLPPPPTATIAQTSWFTPCGPMRPTSSTPDPSSARTAPLPRPQRHARSPTWPTTADRSNRATSIARQPSSPVDHENRGTDRR